MLMDISTSIQFNILSKIADHDARFDSVRGSTFVQLHSRNDVRFYKSEFETLYNRFPCIQIILPVTFFPDHINYSSDSSKSELLIYEDNYVSFEPLNHLFEQKLKLDKIINKPLSKLHYIYDDILNSKSTSVDDSIEDGDKNINEISAPLNNEADNTVLRLRSVDAPSKMDLIQMDSQQISNDTFLLENNPNIQSCVITNESIKKPSNVMKTKTKKNQVTSVEIKNAEIPKNSVKTNIRLCQKTSVKNEERLSKESQRTSVKNEERLPKESATKEAKIQRKYNRQEEYMRICKILNDPTSELNKILEEFPDHQFVRSVMIDCQKNLRPEYINYLNLHCKKKRI